MSSVDITSDLAFERSLYIGNHIAILLYGITLAIFFMTVHTWYHAGPQRSPSDLRHIIYGFFVLSLWTISRACNVSFGMLAWINHRTDPGGPAGYLATHQIDPVNILGTFASIVGNWMIDGLLLYRCCIFWSGVRVIQGSIWRGKMVLILPAAVFLGSIAMSILMGWESARPGAAFFRGRTVSFAVPYFILVVTLNLILTIWIVTPVILIRRETRQHVGGGQYTNPVAMMVESGALVTVSGLVFIIFYARKSPASFALLQIWGSCAPMSSLLIILRKALGRAWSANNPNPYSDVEFAGVNHFASLALDVTEPKEPMTPATPTTPTVSDTRTI